MPNCQPELLYWYIFLQVMSEFQEGGPICQAQKYKQAADTQ